MLLLRGYYTREWLCEDLFLCRWGCSDVIPDAWYVVLSANLRMEGGVHWGDQMAPWSYLVNNCFPKSGCQHSLCLHKRVSSLLMINIKSILLYSCAIITLFWVTSHNFAPIETNVTPQTHALFYHSYKHNYKIRYDPNEGSQMKRNITAIILVYKRYEFIPKVLHTLYSSNIFQQVIIWNNNPATKIGSDNYDIVPNQYRPFIINSPHNIRDLAKYKACALANTTACWYQDDGKDHKLL